METRLWLIRHGIKSQENIVAWHVMALLRFHGLQIVGPLQQRSLLGVPGRYILEQKDKAEGRAKREKTRIHLKVVWGASMCGILDGEI